MSFRSALLASAAILTAGSAFAADLPARVAAPAPYIAAPIFTWTGFYVGLNAGAGWNNGDNGFGWAPGVVPANTVFVGNNNNDTGFTGGAQAGYNMQFGSFVAGVEADINYIDRGNGGVAVAGANPAGTYFLVNRGDSNNWFGTLRGRLGFAFDRALIYATGGLAFGGNNGDASVTACDGVPCTGVNNLGTLVGTGGNNNNVGWTLGGGVEYAFSNAWSVKLEYLHVDLGSHSRTFDVTNALAAPAPTFITVENKNRFDLVRAGVNFRF